MLRVQIPTEGKGDPAAPGVTRELFVALRVMPEPGQMLWELLAPGRVAKARPGEGSSTSSTGSSEPMEATLDLESGAGCRVPRPRVRRDVSCAASAAPAHSMAPCRQQSRWQSCRRAPCCTLRMVAPRVVAPQGSAG